MQIRCYRCGWSFAIKQDEAAFALQALEETAGTHYDSNCPRCRHSNRISLEQLRKAVPRAATEPQVSDTNAGQQEAEPVESSDQEAVPNVEDSAGEQEDPDDAE